MIDKTYKNKRVLLIAGGGTLGTHVGQELLRLGCRVDVICPEDKISDRASLRFIKGLATEELLSDLFAQNRYDGIVNFLHYADVASFKRAHDFLIQNTGHLIVLSSYRVYADAEHPITESAPRLHEVYGDDVALMEQDTYGVSKARCEDFLVRERAGEPWTIVRPVISFSQYRFDLLLYSGDQPIRYARENRPICMPSSAKDLHAGFDWAGNSGKLIAHLLFKERAIGESFTIYSGHGMTWGQVADAYGETMGLRVKWVSEDEFFESDATLQAKRDILWAYDRAFDRAIDCRKVMDVTGLSREDFATVSEGIATELALYRQGGR